MNLVALVLALVMVLSVASVALAAASDNVSVTVSGIAEGNTLKLYKIAGASVAADNTLSYTMNSSRCSPESEFCTSQNIIFRVYLYDFILVRFKRLGICLGVHSMKQLSPHISEQ